MLCCSVPRCLDFRCDIYGTLSTSRFERAHEADGDVTRAVSADGGHVLSQATRRFLAEVQALRYRQVLLARPSGHYFTLPASSIVLTDFGSSSACLAQASSAVVATSRDPL